MGGRRQRRVTASACRARSPAAPMARGGAGPCRGRGDGWGRCGRPARPPRSIRRAGDPLSGHAAAGHELHAGARVTRRTVRPLARRPARHLRRRRGRRPVAVVGARARLAGRAAARRDGRRALSLLVARQPAHRLLRPRQAETGPRGRWIGSDARRCAIGTRRDLGPRRHHPFHAGERGRPESCRGEWRPGGLSHHDPTWKRGRGDRSVLAHISARRAPLPAVCARGQQGGPRHLRRGARFVRHRSSSKRTRLPSTARATSCSSSRDR